MPIRLSFVRVLALEIQGEGKFFLLVVDPSALERNCEQMWFAVGPATTNPVRDVKSVRGLFISKL